MSQGQDLWRKVNGSSVVYRRRKWLLAEIKRQINAGEIETWAVDTAGDFTHLTRGDQWANSAWLRPKPLKDQLLLNLIPQPGGEKKRVVYSSTRGGLSKWLYGTFPNCSALDLLPLASRLKIRLSISHEARQGPNPGDPIGSRSRRGRSTRPGEHPFGRQIVRGNLLPASTYARTSGKSAPRMGGVRILRNCYASCVRVKGF